MSRNDDDWLEVHVGLPDHPKTARLRRRLGLGVAAAVGHAVTLWLWSVRYAPDGQLGRFDPDVIADAAGWEHEPADFVRAMVAAGFLNDDLSIHDWDAYVGRLMDRREANKQRMKEARKKLKARLNGATDATHEPDVPASSGPRAAHVQGLPDRTGPDLTGPDRTPPPNPPPHAEGGEALTKLKAADRKLWSRACDALRSDMKPANWSVLLDPLEPLGRRPDGGLVVRAPPTVASRVGPALRRALLDAGDPTAKDLTLVEQGWLRVSCQPGR